MPRWLSRIALVCCLLGLVAYAYAPLTRATFLGRDVQALVDSSRLAWPGELEAEPGLGPESRGTAELVWTSNGERRPLASWSLALSSRVWTKRGAWTPRSLVALRAENVVYVLLAALALGFAVRRVLLPWFGSDGADAAAWASALVLACHPLCVWAVFHPGARGDLLAAITGAMCVAVFLRGRQDRRPAPVCVAAACAIACAFASDLAWFLPAALAAVELASARRYRALHVRLRTAATTFIVFAGCIAIERFSAAALHAPLARTDPWHDLAGLASISSWERAIAKLACIVLPASRTRPGTFDFVLAGVMMLAALHPALVAARSAPRMWATLGLTWCAVLLALSFRRATVEISPRDFSSAEILFPGAIAMAAALGVASSALSGVRRELLPLVIAASAAVLSRAAASTLPEATADLDALRRDLHDARVLHGRDAHLLVIDPPEKAAGLDLLSGAVPLLLDPALPAEESSAPAGGANGDARAAPAGWVRSIELAALYALAREPEFVEMRRAKLVLIFRERLMRGEDSAGSARIALRLSEPDDKHDKNFWRESARSPLLDFDPLASRAVRVVVLPAASTAEAPELTWRASAEAFEYGAKSGVWLHGLEGPLAIFDLSRSFAWLCGKRIRRLSFQQASTQLVSTEVLDDVPALRDAIELRPRGDDWVAALPTASLPVPVVGESHWVLELLDLERFAFVEIDATRSTVGELVFPGAGAFERSVLRARGGPIAWTLDYRVGSTDVAHRAGRKP